MAFNQARHIVNNSCTFNDNSGRNRINGFEQLRTSIAEGAFHNSYERFDPPKCHPETRTAVIDMIMAWVNNRQRTSSIMWLHGPAGAGKSAIVQTITEECEKSKTLCASFFFSRTAAKRNTADHLIATISHQLIRVIPQLENSVIKAVESDSALFSLSLRNPILDLMEVNLWPKDCPQFVAIDGLDECNNPTIQKLILTVISEALISSNIPLCFLVASRPELALREAFNTESVLKLSTRLALDDTFDPDKDIEIFLRSKFTEIIQTHQLRPSLLHEWPSDDTTRTLVRRSSGQFIYASVVMKYLGNPRKSPVKGLNIILGLAPPGTDTPYSPLDQLYHYILSNVDDYPATSRVLGAILYIANRYASDHSVGKTLDDLDFLLLLERGDAALYLSDLHSVVYVPSQESSNLHAALEKSDSDGDNNSLNSSSHRTSAVRFFHASFSDFLTNASRSGQYVIEKDILFGDIALSSNLDLDLTDTIESDVLLVLKCLSLLMDKSQADSIFTSLQNAMDLHHLDLLSSWPSSNISQTIYAVLGRIVVVDIWDSGLYHFVQGNIRRITEYPIHLPYVFGVLSRLLDPNYKLQDTDLQFLLSQMSDFYDLRDHHTVGHAISKNNIQLSMRNDIWKSLISNERGPRAKQSWQSFKLPTVLIVEDSKFYLKGSGVASSGQQGVVHLKIAYKDLNTTLETIRRILRKLKQLGVKLAPLVKSRPTRKGSRQ
ncbi:hypothetical protein BDQ12DRAFT_715252 [Crucibulum laeve]|uniref:Nephrocystin 3-like N-terminal domain-containing protein n=1 Tax=Crucibulum laeve TaxID=68775 RepID=A0A5C3LRE9_9AGAR|nr:hypothetical protein BDQ12DRAFT_715252 [Crucibulum laeve]